MLSAPEEFYNNGYSYSLGLDADVLLAKSFDMMKIFRETENFSGIQNQASILSNLSGIMPEDFLHKYDINPQDAESFFNPNTGVLF